VNLKPPVNASVAKTSLVPSSYESVFKISTFTIKLAPLRKMVQISYSESTTMMTLTITKIKGLAILRNAIHTGLTVDSANQTEKKNIRSETGVNNKYTFEIQYRLKTEVNKKMYHSHIEHQKLDFKPNYILYVKLRSLRMQAYNT
jgi:hypothetical protein